jgi:hypothetical protein
MFHCQHEWPSDDSDASVLVRMFICLAYWLRLWPLLAWVRFPSRQPVYMRGSLPCLLWCMGVACHVYKITFEIVQNFLIMLLEFEFAGLNLVIILRSS